MAAAHEREQLESELDREEDADEAGSHSVSEEDATHKSVKAAKLGRPISNKKPATGKAVSSSKRSRSLLEGGEASTTRAVEVPTRRTKKTHSAAERLEAAATLNETAERPAQRTQKSIHDALQSFIDENLAMLLRITVIRHHINIPLQSLYCYSIARLSQMDGTFVHHANSLLALSAPPAASNVAWH
jgi:hypothetical protein